MALMDPTIGQALESWADRQPEKPFVKCSQPWVTYGEAERRTAEIGAGLLNLGVTKGARVAVLPRAESSLLALGRIWAISASKTWPRFPMTCPLFEPFSRWTGLFDFVDRKKDAIRRRGKKGRVDRFRARNLRHPKIAAVAAFGVSSPLGEEEIKVCMVLSENEIVKPPELFEFFKRTLPYFAVPRYVSIAEAPAVNANGRVMKSVLREVGIGTAWDFEAMGLLIARHERRL